MPTLSVFFRKDDVPKWKAIENKSEWLHRNLAHTDIPEIERIKRELDRPVNFTGVETQDTYIQYADEPTLTPPEEVL